MLTDKIKKQIKFWQVYSVVAPLGFVAVAAWLHYYLNISIASLFELAAIVTVVTCVTWWHWSMITMLTLMSAVSKADAYFDKLDDKLRDIQRSLQD